MFKKYMMVMEQIGELKVSWKDKLLSLAAGLIISLLIFAGPITLFANLLIYYDTYKLFSILIFISVVMLIFITEVFYYKGITKGQIEKLYNVYLIDSFLYLAAIIFYIVITLI